DAVRRLFRGRRIDDRSDLVDLIGGKAAALGMLADQILVGGAIDAINLVVGDVAVDPLDLRPEITEDGAGGLRGHLEVFGTELPSTRHFSLDHKFWHVTS